MLMKKLKRFIVAGVMAVVVTVSVDARQPNFSESEVTVVNDAGNVSLAGTLTRPAEGVLKGAVVLATGSGQQNRDEEIMGHRPFRSIAERLSTAGYAVLRLDDRGIGGSTGDFASATTDDFVSDISAALHYVDSCCRGVPAGVIGHSEGGNVAIRAGVSDPKCRFIVTLAAPAWRGDSLIMSQSRALAVAMTGRWDNEPLQRRILDLAMSDMPASLARPMIYMVLSEAAGDAAKIPEVQKQLNSQVDALLSPWYRNMLRYDPTADIAGVAVPWLALNGSKDVQVLPANLETISALNGKAVTRLLDGHNHLFQRAATGMPQEYATIVEDISEDTLDAIVEWLDATVGSVDGF